MIPASLFHAKLPGIPEVRALDFAPDYFTFRLAKRELPTSGPVTAHFYQYSGAISKIRPFRGRQSYFPA